MISYTDFVVRKSQKPFVPFAIVLDDDQTLFVANADNILVGVDTLKVGTPSTEHPSICDSIRSIAIARITQVQDIQRHEPAQI